MPVFRNFFQVSAESGVDCPVDSEEHFALIIDLSYFLLAVGFRDIDNQRVAGLIV